MGTRVSYTIGYEVIVCKGTYPNSIIEVVKREKEANCTGEILEFSEQVIRELVNDGWMLLSGRILPSLIHERKE